MLLYCIVDQYTNDSYTIAIQDLAKRLNGSGLKRV